jgi:hypothetical protein
MLFLNHMMLEATTDLRTLSPSPSGCGDEVSRCARSQPRIKGEGQTGLSSPLSAPSRLCVKTGPGKPVQNPSKNDHFHKCDFFTPLTSTTYNFNALKCTRLKVGTSRRAVRFPPKRDKMRHLRKHAKLVRCGRGTYDTALASRPILDSCASSRSLWPSSPPLRTLSFHSLS